MAFSVRQIISSLFPNSGNEPINQPLAAQKSLLEKLGTVFNVSDPATSAKNVTRQQTALRNVSSQINLSDAEINAQLERAAVREGVVAAPTVRATTAEDDKEERVGLYLAGGYALFPEDVCVRAKRVGWQKSVFRFGSSVIRSHCCRANRRELATMLTLL